MMERAMSDNIQVWADYVLVFGKRIERPARMAPSQWMRFWEYRKG
jgi:hypothetical protein